MLGQDFDDAQMMIYWFWGNNYTFEWKKIVDTIFYFLKNFFQVTSLVYEIFYLILFNLNFITPISVYSMFNEFWCGMSIWKW